MKYNFVLKTQYQKWALF